MNEEVRHFSLRKLSVGLASVVIGVSIFGTSQTVKADTLTDSQASTVTNNAQSSDTQENGNTAKSSFSSDNQTNNVKSNLIQTQVEGKKDQKQDSVPKTQEVNDGSNLDAEKDIVRTSSLQGSDNQSNNRAEDNSQTQNSQKLDLTKNSPKFARKMLATNLIETTSSPTTNGGFDEATWGKLDVTKWYGYVQDGVYELTSYAGDPSHIIVPNEADFEKAGKSTNGLQVGITRDTANSLFVGHLGQTTIAFSKTNNQKVKAIGTDWSGAFLGRALSKFDGSNLDVSKVTNMGAMFGKNSISDLKPLANWNTSKVTYMDYMFAYNPDLNDLRPIANWNISNVNINNDESFSSLFAGDAKLDLTNINNTKLMQSILKSSFALAGATFITNNADLVKVATGKDLPDSTNTAKRTITFNLPHATPRTIVQIINYKAIAPVQVDFDNQEIVQTYPVKESDWQLDTSKQNDDVIIDGVICFKPVKIPHVNGYKAHLVKNKLNPAMFMVSFVAVPNETKPSLPDEVTPSTPATTDKPFAKLNHKVVDALNQSDSGWMMPENNSIYTVEVPADNTIDLSDLVIAEPVHAMSDTIQIHVTKRFKLSKKHSIKHLKHRKKAVRQFKKYRL